jgi:hypothetical protein
VSGSFVRGGATSRSRQRVHDSKPSSSGLNGPFCTARWLRVARDVRATTVGQGGDGTIHVYRRGHIRRGRIVVGVSLEHRSPALRAELSTSEIRAEPLWRPLFFQGQTRWPLNCLSLGLWHRHTWWHKRLRSWLATVGRACRCQNQHGSRFGARHREQQKSRLPLRPRIAPSYIPSVILRLLVSTCAAGLPWPCDHRCDGLD